MAIKEKSTILEVNEYEIPQDLKDIPNWILWRAEWNNKQQQYAKIPYSLNGYRASSTNNKMWNSFNEINNEYTFNDKYEGIGFVLSDTNNLVCLDIDNAIDENGQINSDLAIEMTKLTYCETSPSGTGLHCFFKGDLPEKRKKKRSDLDIELYDSKRFMTVTGYAIGQSEICDDQEVLNNLVKRYFKADESVTYSEVADSESSTDLRDEEVIQIMMKSKQKDKISDLLKGRYEKYFDSPSEAVQSLLHYLAFYTGKNQQQMERIFLTYNNLTDKWDSKRGNTTWGHLEINKAINTQKEVYKIKKNDETEKWIDELRTSKSTGAYKKTTTNGELIIKNDKYLKDLVRYDVFEKVTKLKRLPQWRSPDDKNYYWSDIDTMHVRAYIDKVYNIQFSTDILDEVIDKEAYQYKFHPIKSFIESKKWDGINRVEKLFIDYLGAADTHYNREVAKKWIMGAVARVYQPGIKFDTMVILYGTQGGGKSTVASKMGGNWYNQSLKSFKGDEALKKVQGSWIIEIEELSAFHNSTIEDIKGFVSAIVDVYRASYGKRVERHPRQCVFIGTTNNYEFLKDRTGNRRFLPVTTDKSKATKSPFEDLTQDIVQQMYAEAKFYFDKNPVNETLLLDKEADKVALEMQNEHAEKDSLVGEIENFIEKPIPSNYYRLSLQEKRMIMARNYDTDDINFYGNGSVIELPNTKPAAYVWRSKICAHEIWKVMLGFDTAPPQHQTRKIDNALREISYCGDSKRQTRYGDGIGKQYGFDVNLKSYYQNL